MKTFLEIFITVVMYIGTIVTIVIHIRKHPPRIKKGSKGKHRDCYIVSVCSMRLRMDYEYYFVKRKNGKYRLIYSIAVKKPFFLSFRIFQFSRKKNLTKTSLKNEQEINSCMLFMHYVVCWCSC